MPALAVCDDDPEFCDYMTQVLVSAGHKVASYPSAGKLLDGLVRQRPALLVLDAQLPGMDGLELVRVLKRNPETRAMPVIIVSATATSPEHVVRGLEDGADEYLSKPVHPDLLLARVEGLLRRVFQGSGDEHEVLQVAGLTVDITEHLVRVDGKAPLPLTKLEFDVLEYFLRHPNRVITRSVLNQEVWRQPPDIDTRTVEKHVQNLRRKLGAPGEWIETVVRMGYVFRPPAGGRRPKD